MNKAGQKLFECSAYVADLGRLEGTDEADNGILQLWHIVESS